MGNPKFELQDNMSNNIIWTIDSKWVLNKFWQWHLNKNIVADKNTGYHIIRVYKKL